MPVFFPKRRRKGFTLSEVLIAVAVLAILAGLAVPNVIRYQRLLNMQALDHSAQEIFLAAQNRVTTLKNAGTLAQVGSETLPTGSADMRCLTQDSIGELMPDLSLESGLMGNYFYVVYDAAGGSVLTVLYSEAAFAYNYGVGAVGKSADERMAQDLWVGYYTGSAAGGGSVVQLDRPVIGFINGEKLQAEITIKRPDNTVSWSSITPKAYIGDSVLDVSFTNPQSVNANTRKYTITLDSLDSNEKQFKDLGAGVTAGQDFHLTVTLLCSASDVIGNTATSATAVNSLFDKVEGETAYISCGRHLQNLNQNTSGVGSAVKKAVQTAAITFSDTTSTTDWYTYYTERGVGYVPVANSSLNSYDGGSLTITGLHAQAGDAGMFVSFGGALKNIYLVNPMITGTRLAGGLAAYSTGALAIDNCRVYHSYPGSTPKKELKGYQIQGGSVAGGLIGQIDSPLTVNNSFAATLISGDDSAGGLVGAGGVIPLQITSSYADCYLSAKEGTVGGLVGRMNGENTTIHACYSAGFVVDALYTAGLVYGNAAVRNSYSAVTHLAEGAEVSPLVIGGTATQSYYLHAPKAAEGALGKQVSSNELKNDKTLTGWFDRATGDTTYAYNLSDSMALRVYPFPKVLKLPHYGDWRAEFESGALVYYEMYTDNTYGFSGGGKNYLRAASDSDVVQDGYAVAYADRAPAGTTTATYAGKPLAVAEAVVTVPVTVDGATSNYYLRPLSMAALNEVAPTQDFYQKITVTVDSVPTQYWMNPHFAATVVEYTGETALAAPEMIYIRSPRQLNALSRWSDTYASRGWRFAQEMTLDYGRYQWAELGLPRPVSQSPIGTTPALAFNGVYDGGDRVIRGIAIAGEKSDIGLFGCNSGTIQNVVFDSPTAVGRTGKISGRGATVCVGGLVGRNTGSVIRCATASLKVGATNAQNSTVYVGGLVGRNDGGLIRQCEAAVATIQVSSIMANAYVGGFAGMDTGAISQSTAHGAIRASRDTTGSVYVAGFAGAGTGSVTNSYCAVGIYADGNPTVSSFCTTEKAGSGNYYLNDGNYVFEENSYTLSYGKINATDASGAQGLKQVELAKKSIPGMTNTVKPEDKVIDDAAANPYPHVLGKHYGGWLKQLDLGDIGVAYWEKEVKGEASEYRFSFKGLALNSTGAVTATPGESLLCGYHNDGGVITEYGYAYYYKSDSKNAVTIANGSEIWTTDATWDKEKAVNAAAAAALYAQMEGRYTFVAYNSYDCDTHVGLRPRGDFKNGRWTLSYDDKTYPYRISPFFAESIEYLTSAAAGDTIGGSAISYGVRSIKQLQYINWNWAEKTVALNSAGRGGSYPYLSQVANNTAPNFYWLQSHDIRAAESGKIETAYAPIGSMSAWFGGSYNGNDYKIENLSFTSDARLVGLFGNALGANLKNIIMCSSDGEAYIKGIASDNSYTGVGGIAGVALVGSAKGSITNCSISGYTISNNATKLGADTGLRTYGSAVGGLVGWCNMDFSNCTAIVTVEGGAKVNAANTPAANSIMRIGALVGSARCKISNCYVGGEVIDSSNGNLNNTYLGGIVGSSDNANTSHGGWGTTLEIRNCYSYVKIGQNTNARAPNRRIYPLGPSGITSSFYLQERVASAASNDSKALSYEAFCDTDTKDGLLYKLNGNSLTGAFKRVTTVDENGTPIDGKYTIPSTQDFRGLNYPFPTILTQNMSFKEDGSVDKTANLHYGDWPRQGLSGSRLVELDLVATDALGNRAHTAVVPYAATGVKEGGTFTVTEPADGTVFDRSIATVTVDAKSGELTVKGLKVGFTTTAVRYSVGGKNYSMDVEIVVTAEVNVLPDPVSVSLLVDGQQNFTGKAYDKNRNPLDVKWVSAVSNTPLVANVNPEKPPSVDAKGDAIVYALKEGDAILTVTAVWADPVTKAEYSGAGRASVSVLHESITAQNIYVGPGKTEAYPLDRITALVADTPVENLKITAVKVADPTAATAAQGKDGVWSFTGLKVGQTTAELSLSFDYGAKTYQRSIETQVQVTDVQIVPDQTALTVKGGASGAVPVALLNAPPGAQIVVASGYDTTLLDAVVYETGSLVITAHKGRVGATTVTLEAYDGATRLAVATIAVEVSPQLTLSLSQESIVIPNAKWSIPVSGSAAVSETLSVSITDMKLLDFSQGAGKLGAVSYDGTKLSIQPTGVSTGNIIRFRVEYDYTDTVDGRKFQGTDIADVELVVDVVDNSDSFASDVATYAMTSPTVKKTIAIRGADANKLDCRITPDTSYLAAVYPKKERKMTVTILPNCPPGLYTMAADNGYTLSLYVNPAALSMTLGD